MSGLAEELAADLADLDDEVYEDEEEIFGTPVAGASSTTNGAAKRPPGVEKDEEMSDAEAEVTAGPNALDAMGVMAGGVRPAEQLDTEAVERMELGAVGDVSTVAKLYGSKRMREIVNVCQSSIQI
jgi:U4/U6 small nuclear ribonucleoprotein PRP31